MIRTARRIAFRVLTRILAALASRMPRLAYGIADAIGTLVWQRLASERLSRVFPELAPDAVRNVRAAEQRVAMRNHVLITSIRNAGMDTVRSMVDASERLAALRPPLILSTFHIGALPGLGPALERVKGDVLVLRSSPPIATDLRPTLTVEDTTGDEQRRAQVFHNALDHLRAGGFVFMPLDPEQSVRVPAPFRGLALHLARGPFAMSRIMQVPIVPIVGRWRGARVEIIVGDPLGPGDESVVAAAAAAWLESYLIENPLEISRRVLDLTT